MKVVERTVDWEVEETAIIVCDMWDDHHCKIAAQRVGLMVPRMNKGLSAARNWGVTIIFAPSETRNIPPVSRRLFPSTHNWIATIANSDP